MFLMLNETRMTFDCGARVMVCAVRSPALLDHASSVQAGAVMIKYRQVTDKNCAVYLGNSSFK